MLEKFCFHFWKKIIYISIMIHTGFRTQSTGLGKSFKSSSFSFLAWKYVMWPYERSGLIILWDPLIIVFLYIGYEEPIILLIIMFNMKNHRKKSRHRILNFLASFERSIIAPIKLTKWKQFATGVPWYQQFIYWTPDGAFVGSHFNTFT